MVSLFIILFIIGGTPFFLDFVKDKIESVVQSQTNVPVRIGSLKGNIFYALEAAELDVGAAIHLNRIKTSYNIFGLLSKRIDIHNAFLDGLHVDVNRVKKLIENLQKPPKQEPKKGKPFKVRIGKLSIVNTELLGAINGKRIDLELAAHGKMVNDIVTIDTLSLRKNTSHVALKGIIPLQEEGLLDVRYSFYLSLEDFDIKDAHGTITSRGQVSGKRSSPKILNDTEFTLRYQNNEFFGSSKMSWQMPQLDGFNLVANLTAKTPTLQKGAVQKDVWNTSLSAQGRQFLCDISSAYGTFHLTGSLKGSFDNPELRADLMAKFRYADFKPEARGKIAFKNKILSIKNFRVSSKKLSLQGSAYLNLGEPQKIDADILLDCDNIDFINNFLESPRPVSGRIKITSKVKGQIQNPFMQGTVECSDITAFSEEIKNAGFIFTLKDSILNLNSGVIQSTRGTINLDGWYGIADSQFNVHISSNELRLKSPEIVGKDTIPISGAVGIDANFKGHITNPQGDGIIDFKDLVYDTIMFDSYELAFAFKDTTLDASLSNDTKSIILVAKTALYRPFKFNGSLRLNHFDLKHYIPVDTGYISAYVSAYGEAIQPEKIEGEVQIESLNLSRDHYSMSNIDTITINFHNGIANITACTIDVHNQRIDVHGHVPLDIERGEIELLCKTSKIDLAALSAVLSNIPEIHGYLSLDVSVQGKLPNPHINGELRLDDVKYSMPDINIDSVYSFVKFNKTDFTIEYMRGNVNAGSFDIKGFVLLADRTIDMMSLNVLLKNIDVKRKEFGSVDLSSAIHATAKKDSIRIGGEVTINKALYDVPFNLQTIIKLLTTANRPPPEQSELVKRIYCDIGISSPHGIKIANNVADVAVDVDLQIRGYLAKVNVYGTITTTKKGTIKYLGKRFDILDATIQFDDPYMINPVLNLEATSFVSSVDGGYEIFMYLTGTVEKWRLELSSSPAVPEQDIISLLLIGKRRPGTYLVEEAKDIDLRGAAKDYAKGFITGSVEQTAERTLGLEKVEITGDILDPMHLDIGVEKRIGERLTLIYGTGIETWEFRRVGLHYDITDNLSIYTLHDQENLNSSVDLDVHIKLK